MEEKNTSAHLEDDELLIEEGLEDEDGTETDGIDDLDDESDLVDGDDEYDFNDEDDEYDDEYDSDDEDDSETDTSDETTEAADDETPVTSGDDEETTDTAQDELKAKMSKLLNKLGYHGAYDEAMAAYEADEQKGNETTESPATEESTPKPVNYAEIAETSLRDINAAFGTEHTDFSKFDNLPRFAALVMGGATAIEAYRATQKQFVSNQTEVNDEEQTVGKPSKGHLKALPAAGAGEGGTSYADRQALASLRELYPERSIKDLRKTLDRVKRARA